MPTPGSSTVPTAAPIAEPLVGEITGSLTVPDSASGTPTLGVFGPSREQVYAPWGRHTAFVRTDLSYDEILAKPGYDYRKSDTHMDSLSVAKVLAAAEALWSRVQAERAA